MQFSSCDLCTSSTAASPARSSARRCSRTLGALTSLLLVSANATAADARNLAPAQARYQADRAACMSDTSKQDRAACLREASAVFQAIKTGRSNQAGAQDNGSNRLRRCDSLPSQQREDCLRRMQGEGNVSGSVESGGVLRELVRPVAPEPVK